MSAGGRRLPRGEGSRGGRPRRWVLLLLLTLFAVGAVLIGLRARDYSVDYYRQVYDPASAGPGAPTYYYLDWRVDWKDPEELRPAVVYGPILTPRAVRVPDSPAENGGGTEHGTDYGTEFPTPSGGWLYDPIGLIQAGLSLHDQVLDEIAAGARVGVIDGIDRRKILLDQVEWLHRSAEWLPDSVAVWSVPWTAERYDLPPPWISALSQGQAISLLTRTAGWGRPQDLVLARGAVRSLLESTLPIVLRDDAGVRFFEEFPADPPSEVLNGCLFAWLGLWDYVRATGDEELRQTCLELLDRIEEQIPDYELHGFGLEGWTRYDARGTRPTSPGYQELHAALAEAIGAETGREFWRVRAKHWRESAGSPWRRLYVFVRVAWHKVATGAL